MCRRMTLWEKLKHRPENRRQLRFWATLALFAALALLTWLVAAGCAAPLTVRAASFVGLDEPEATRAPDGWAWCVVVRRSGRWSLGMYWRAGSEADPRYLAGVRWLDEQGGEIALSAGQAFDLMRAATVAVDRGADPNTMPDDPEAGPWRESVMVVGPSLGDDCWRWGLARPVSRP